MWDVVKDAIHVLYIIGMYEGVRWLVNRRLWRYRFNCKVCNMKFSSNNKETRDRVRDSHKHIGAYDAT